MSKKLQDHRKLHTASIVALTGAGLFLSLLSFWVVHDWERRGNSAMFDSHAAGVVSVIEREMTRNMEVLQSVASLYSSADVLTRADFGAFCRALLKHHNDIQAIEWVPRLSGAERQGYEAAARMEGYPDFQISVRDAQGQMIPSEDRDEYYPVYYVEPYQGNEKALGFDLASDELRKKSLIAAAASGVPTGSQRITLVQESGDQYGFLVYIPVYRKGAGTPDTELERQQQLEGFIVGVFRVGNLVSAAMKNADNPGIQVFLFDVSDPQRYDFLYKLGGPQRDDRQEPSLAGLLEGGNSFRFAKAVSFAGRTWRIQCSSTPEFARRVVRWSSTVVLIGGLMATALVAGFMTLVARRTRDIERLVTTLESEISERKMVAAALKEGEERYRTLFEKAGDAIFILEAEGDNAGRIISANQAAADMHGYSLDRLLQMNIRDLDGPEDSLKAAERIQRMRDGEWVAEEATHVKQDGTTFAVALSAGVVKFNDRLAILAFDRDISEQRKAERARQLLATAIEQAGESIEITDAQARFVYVNPSFEAITGYRRAEVYGRNPNILKSGRHDKAFYAQLWNRISNGRNWSGRFINRHKDGHLVHLEATISPVLDSDGVINHYVAVKRDITEEIGRQEQLRQAQKMEAIGTLAGGIAHDFNNILSAVIGFTELSLGQVEKGGLVEDSLMEVLNAGKRAKELVHQILTFSRQKELESQPVQVRAIVKEALKLIRPSVPATIDIQQFVESDSLVMADPTQVHQILMNLCTNATYAMDQIGGGVLTVRLADVQIGGQQNSPAGLPPGKYLKLTVADTGAGMTPAVQAQIFDPYFTTKPHGEGTGLGLAVSLGIVKNYRGDIAVSSDPGKGTVFDVYLPVYRTHPDSGGPAAAHEELPTGSERILFVDDEQATVKVAVQTLEQLGYRVSGRTSSVEALALFCNRPADFDLLVTDMTMPNMTGDRLAVEVMRVRPDFPVLLCTGYSRQISLETASALGIRALLMKPILKREMAVAIRNVLDGKDARAAVTGNGAPRI